MMKTLAYFHQTMCLTKTSFTKNAVLLVRKQRKTVTKGHTGFQQFAVCEENCPAVQVFLLRFHCVPDVPPQSFTTSPLLQDLQFGEVLLA